MVARSIELGGKRKLNLNLLNRGLTIDTIDSDGNVESSICIEDDDLVELINLYETLKHGKQGGSYIMCNLPYLISPDDRGDEGGDNIAFYSQ